MIAERFVCSFNSLITLYCLFSCASSSVQFENARFVDLIDLKRPLDKNCSIEVLFTYLFALLSSSLIEISICLHQKECTRCFECEPLHLSIEYKTLDCPTWTLDDVGLI